MTKKEKQQQHNEKAMLVVKRMLEFWMEHPELLKEVMKKADEDFRQKYAEIEKIGDT